MWDGKLQIIPYAGLRIEQRMAECCGPDVTALV